LRKSCGKEPRKHPGNITHSLFGNVSSAVSETYREITPEIKRLESPEKKAYLGRVEAGWRDRLPPAKQGKNLAMKG
jgi:hypothetical protein